jgi:hypothetical protein
MIADDSRQLDLGGKRRHESERSNGHESETDQTILFIDHGMSLLKNMIIEPEMTAHARPGENTAGC